MKPSQILGALWLLAGLGYFAWRAHKAGALKPMCEGAGVALLIMGFIAIGLHLLLDTQWK
jgi:uncharacterized membrane protein